jgi:DNA (cytosine-5)-methyltransferase 1
MLLKQDYPKAKQYTDATKDIPEHRPTIISITSECQDISIGNPSAAGVFGHRSILIFDCLNICGQLKPDYIVIENSAAITKRGLEYVLCKLSEIGYDAAWHCLPLTAFKVQLRRERLYLIARANKIGLQRNPIQEVFSESIIQEQFKGVSPGWRDRRAIPSPRTIRTTHGFANYANRIKVIGNMVHPRAAQYLFACIINDIKSEKSKNEDAENSSI